jgi:hypothetical protein
MPRIQNPLAGISKTLLLQDVDDFASKHGLMDARLLLRKGALVAQDPNSYDEIGGAEALDDSEVDALRDEVLHKWKQSSSLYITVIMVSPDSCLKPNGQSPFRSFSIKAQSFVKYFLFLNSDVHLVFGRCCGSRLGSNR